MNRRSRAVLFTVALFAALSLGAGAAQAAPTATTTATSTQSDGNDSLIWG
ncbi:hypothetical protein AB0B50_27440 [Streptomyces sp. NPDC041068]